VREFSRAHVLWIARNMGERRQRRMRIAYACKGAIDYASPGLVAGSLFGA
jgi:hypothetical protein